MERRPIVFLIHSLPYGGAERLTLDLLAELSAQGEAVHLITLAPEKDKSLAGECALEAEYRTLVPVRGVFDIAGIVRLARTLRRLQPRALVTHLWFSNTVGRVAGALAGVPRIITYEHNDYDRVKSRKQFLADRLLAPLSSTIVAVSDAVKASLVRHHISPKRITVIQNGVALGRFAPAPIQVRARVQALFVGRLTRQKGLDVLLEALSRVPEIELSVAGMGEEEQALQRQAELLNLSGRVTFLGVCSDIPARMHDADFLVLPSRWEGMPMIVLEALASGLPVLASAVDGIPEIVEDGIQGLLVAPEDTAALISALERMQDPVLRARLGAAGPARARLFSIEAHAQKLLALLT